MEHLQSSSIHSSSSIEDICENIKSMNLSKEETEEFFTAESAPWNSSSRSSLLEVSMEENSEDTLSRFIFSSLNNGITSTAIVDYVIDFYKRRLSSTPSDTLLQNQPTSSRSVGENRQDNNDDSSIIVAAGGGLFRWGNSSNLNISEGAVGSNGFQRFRQGVQAKECPSSSTLETRNAELAHVSRAGQTYTTSIPSQIRSQFNFTYVVNGAPVPVNPVVNVFNINIGDTIVIGGHSDDDSTQ